MDLSQYKQMLMLFPDKPDLNKLDHNDNIPESWPLVLKRVTTNTNDLLNFDITDSKITLSCQIKDSKMIEKIVSMKNGQIIFLYDSKIIKNKELDDILIDTGIVYTLKEVNDGLVKPSNKKDIQLEKAPRKIVIRKNVAPQVRKNAPAKQELDCRWRTLTERWQRQGKI